MRPAAMIEQPPDGLPAVPGHPAPPDERRLVLVPHEQGSIVPLEIGQGREVDDLDVLVDEVFGPSTDERPGAFDVLLLLGGIALLVWALLARSALWVVILAGAAIVLWKALPARSLFRRYRGARTARRIRSAGRRGYVLDVEDRSTADLVAAYAALVDAAALPGSVYSDRALDAAHAAVVEVATLLHGVPPDGTEQRGYVAKRTAAITDLAGLLSDAHRRRLDAQHASELAQEDRRHRWVAAVTRARDELQAEDRQGSLAQLGRLSRRLRREAEDDDG
jgi:hypothetical protein